MRVILTLLAVALVALMTAALVVPYFVDWSAHRDEIAERLAGLTGGRVTLTGSVTLRLLPTPYLEVGAGSAAAAGAGAPSLTFEGARLELALIKLASGVLRFTEVTLEKPVLTLTRGADGSLIAPASAPAPVEAVGFDRFSAHDGTIRVATKGGGADLTIAGVEVDGDAPSLAGPYHVAGQAEGPGGAPVVFRLASEKAGDAGAPVRLAVDAGPSWPALEFDGILSVFGGTGTRASGDATISGTSPGVDGPTPWRASGRLAADLDGARLANADFRFGPDERALSAQGSAALIARGGLRLALDAKAKQANLDAFLRRKGEDAVPPKRAAAMIASALQPALAGVGGAALEVRLAVGTAILGGETLEGLSAALEAKPGAPPKTRFELGLPGRSRIRGEGAIETGEAAKFAGAIDASTEDVAALAGWAGKGAPAVGAWAEALGDASPPNLALSGDVEASATRLSGSGLRITLGSSILTGAVAMTPPGAGAGRIEANLSADSLDIEALPSLDSARSLVDGADFALTLDAKSLHVAHLGEAEINGAAFALKLLRTGPKLILDRLSIAGLGGASLEAAGALGPDGARASGRLTAEKLADFAALIARLAPSPASRALVERAALLSPASIAFEASGGPAGDGAPALQSLTANGTIASTKAALSLAPAAKGGGQSIALVLDSPDSAALMRQLGLGRPATPLGAGHAELHASGAWAPGYDVDASAALAGAALSARGRYAPAAEGDDARLFGKLGVKGDNLAPLAAMLRLAPAGGAIGPADASAEVTLRGERWTFSRILATVAGVKASGGLVYEAPPEAAGTAAAADLERAEEAASGLASPPAPAALTGELTLDRLRLADLAALALGPPAPPVAGKVWPDNRFGAPPIVPPAAAVRVNVATLSLSDALVAQGFSTNLRFGKGRLDLDDMAMRLADGAVSGRATLRRSGDAATLDGAATVEPALVKRPGFSGRVGGKLDFASTGKSVADLIAGLAGGGTAEFSGAALARSDPFALETVVAAAQGPDAKIDETNVGFALAAALDRGPLPIPNGSTPIAMSAGTMKLGPIAIARRGGDATLTASLDLPRMTLETRLQLIGSDKGLKFWAGPPPAATVTVANALDQPKRRIDAAGLAAGLATQAIARESDRIATLEADIRERAFFNRRLKGERFLDRRKAEIEDWRAEQDRLKGLAEHLSEQREEERTAAEKAAEKAGAEKAAAEKAAAERAAAQKAAAERADAPPQPEAPPAADGATGRPPQPNADALGSEAPVPPARPKAKPAPLAAPDPSASGIY